MKRPTPDFLAILRTLSEHGVDFVVVGGVAGVLHGATITTFDLDVVHSREPDNLNRLLKALDALEARYRTPGAANRKPDRSHLSSDGHQLLLTDTGPLDLLGTIGEGHGFEDLIRQSVEMDAGEGWKVRVLDLPALIRIKQETAQEKDKAVLAVLRRTLEEKSKT